MTGLTALILAWVGIKLIGDDANWTTRIGLLMVGTAIMLIILNMKW